MEKELLELKLKEIEPILKGIIYKFFSTQLDRFDDLWQEANLSAIKAMENYKEGEKSASLKSYLQIVVRRDLIVYSNRDVIRKDIYCDEEYFERSGSEDDHSDLDHQLLLNKAKKILSNQEFKVLQLLVNGYTFKEIDKILNINSKNRSVICYNIKRKLINKEDR